MTKNVRSSSGLAGNLTVLALIEALFPPGNILAGPDTRAFARTVAGYADKIPGMTSALTTALLVLDSQYFLRHGRTFRTASLASRRNFLQRHEQGKLKGRFLQLLSLPLRAAYVLDDVNIARVNAGVDLRVPAQSERQRWQQQITPVEAIPGYAEYEADVVIIGTGAGGAAAAYALASKGLAVLIIEEGRYFQRQDFSGRLTDVIPKLYRASGATVAVGNTVIPVPVGKNVGGTTTINSGTCLRTPDSVLTQWVQEGLSELTPANMQSYFQQVEAILQVQTADPRYVGEIGNVIGRGALALGLQQTHPLRRNATGCDGQGLCQFGCPTDAKQSTNVSYIPRALAAGACLLTGLQAQTLHWQQRQVSGVTAFGTDALGIRKQIRVKARHVIVAMGSFFSPLFLARNGVRNRWLGRNLSLHPCGVVTGYYPDHYFDHARRIPQGFGISDLAAEGIVFEGGTPPFAAHGLLNPLLGAEWVDFLERWQHTGYFGFMIKDESRGSVQRGLHPDVPFIRYSMNQRDFDLFKRGLKMLAQMHLRAGAQHVILPGYTIVNRIENEQQLNDFFARQHRPSQFAITAYHPLGTARLGRDAQAGVCDLQHQVFGTQGLYVMDGSSVPSSLGANPQITIMALAIRAAERLADKIQQEYSQSA